MLRIEEVEVRMILGQFQVCVIKCAYRSDITPVAFKVISKHALSNADQVRNNVSTKIIQLMVCVIPLQHFRQQVHIEDVDAHRAKEWGLRVIAANQS